MKVDLIIECKKYLHQHKLHLWHTLKRIGLLFIKTQLI